MRVLVTGAYGFIGSNLVLNLLENEPSLTVYALDSMTYAARPDYLFSTLENRGDQKLRFKAISADVNEPRSLELNLSVTQPDVIFHLAAESHVCRSIEGPRQFVQTNVVGTFNLLEAIRIGCPNTRLVHVSTDEVFGELLKNEPPFSEDTQIAPRSPYAASKAASDHLVMAYHHTYGLNATVTNCSNNFGPNQHEEKLIPKTIAAILSSKPVSVYGSGQQVRDWLWVDDHCEALRYVAARGLAGKRYCIGGENERTNLDVIQDVLMAVREATGQPFDASLVHTNDRPTDDQRYAIDCSSMKSLGWAPTKAYHDKLRDTVRWYLATLGRGPVAQESGSGKS